MEYPKLENRWTSEDFTRKVLDMSKTRKVEELFSKQLRTLPMKEVL